MSDFDVLQEDMRIAAAILEWEMGDIWGHIGARVPGDDSIIARLFRQPEQRNLSEWFVQFDYSLNKRSGVGTVPSEAAIYSEVFKARPDVNAAVHSHAPMCVTLSMADKTVSTMHQQSKKFGSGVPVYPDPIFIIDSTEGSDLAKTLGQAAAVLIKGHGVVTVGKTVDEACMTAMYLERTAKMLAFAHLLGFEGPTEEFMQKMDATSHKREARGREIGREKRPGDYSYEWDYYADKVRKGLPWMRGWT